MGERKMNQERSNDNDNFLFLLLFCILMNLNRLVPNRGHHLRLHRHQVRLAHFRHDWPRYPVHAVVDLVLLRLSLAPPVCYSKWQPNYRFHRQSMMTIWNDPIAVVGLATVVAIGAAVVVNVVLMVTMAAASVSHAVIATNHVVIAIVKIVTWLYAMMPATKSSIVMALCCALVSSAGLMASICIQSK